MISSNYDFIFELYSLQAFEERQEVLLFAISGEITSMNKDISFNFVFYNLLHPINRTMCI